MLLLIFNTPPTEPAGEAILLDIARTLLAYWALIAASPEPGRVIVPLSVVVLSAVLPPTKIG